ncbi:hypothetical protein [Aeromonas phage 14AhydR10PP]|nr:hypothetical protein [Aeromonas phage 14AhydR10PP]
MTMTDLTMKANRLSTIHKDLCAVAQAVTMGASDITTMGSTIKAASEKRHTPEVDKMAERVDRMTLHTDDMGYGLRTKIRDVLLAYKFQRDNCKRNKAQFVQQGSIVSALTDGGMFQELIALRKDAKVKAVVSVEITEQPTTTPPAKVCPELGPECRGCPDCGAVMGDATYQEMFGEEAPLKPAKVELTEEIKAVARNSIKGLTIRVAELTKGIEEMPEDLGKEWLIVSALGTVAYEPFQGALRPALRMEKAIGFKGMLDAHAAAPHDVQVMPRIDALKAVLHSSQEALSKMQEVMGGEA